MTRLPATRQQQGDAVGLLWQKIVPIVRSRGQEGEDRDKDPVVRGVADSRAPAEWPAAFHRLVRRTPPGPTRAVGTFRAQGRVLCGLGLPNGLDNGLSLHPVYGVPYLPGSSLKGITRAWCRERYAGTTWGDATPGSALAELLGLGDDDGGPLGGVVAFFDAPWVPVADQRPWAVEIVTPHMVGYYADKRGQTPPDGVEAPKPNPYLAAEGSFRVVIEGPEGWVDRAMTLLTEALRERGVGAKTRAGYGRLLPGPDHDADRAARAAASERAARAAADAEAARLRAELRVLTASVCYDRGDPDSLERALTELTEAIRDFSGMGDPRTAARLLNDQAAVWVRIGDVVRAAHLLRQSRELLTGLGDAEAADRADLAETNHLLARLPLHVSSRPGREQDALHQALTHAREAEASYGQLGLRREQARTWSTLGRLHLMLGEASQARKHLNQAFHFQEQLGDALGLAQTAGALAEALALEGDAARALEMLSSSIALNANLGARAGLRANRESIDAIARAWPAEHPGVRQALAKLRRTLDQAEGRQREAGG